MAYHILMPRPLNAAEAAAVDVGGERPRVANAMLSRLLNAPIHAPHDEVPNWLDNLKARLDGPPAMWTAVRRLSQPLTANDVVFCSSEAGGLHLAATCGSGRAKPKICLFVHNLDRPRGRVVSKLFGIAKRVDLLLACSSTQVDFLREHLSLPASRVRFVWDHTDDRFFTPGPQSAGQPRPTIVSVGLEKRDYHTLAAATADLDVDVKVSGFSEDASVLAETFPAQMPANMTRRFYAWHDLVQLYRDAGVVVVSVHPNRYAAGVQNLMEAMACGRPVIATATEGLKSYLDADCVTCVPPGDPVAMRNAITGLLADRPRAEGMAQRGLALAGQRHGIDRYVDELADHLRALASDAVDGAH